MRCPYCGNVGTNVRTSRLVDGKRIRIRICQNCRHLFFTEEMLIDPNTGYFFEKLYRAELDMRKDDGLSKGGEHTEDRTDKVPE